MLEKVIQFLDDNEYLLMIASHVAMLVFYPFAMESSLPSFWLSILITFILISGLYAAHEHKQFLKMTMWLGSLAVALTWFWYVFIDSTLIELSLSLVWLLFFCVITYNLVRDIHSMKEVNHHMIYGSIAGYLILWLIAAFVFAIVEIVLPGSFSWFSVQYPWFPDFMYYSYVSITTLWYGDILPVSYHAQSWTIFFTLMGQMYLAVLIWMIVGKYIRR